MTDTDPQKAAYAFLTQNSIGALATKSPDGNPRVRLVYYASDDSFSIYFLSLANTRKVADIHADPAAAFVVASSDTHHTLQMEGAFEEMTDTVTFGPVLSELTKHLFPKGEISAPITHLDAAHPVFFKFTPTWIQWSDFTLGTESKDVVFKIR
jgi:general stress protein 26